MSLADRVSDDLKQAMRSKNSLRLSALRALRNEIIKFSKSKQNNQISDGDVIKMVKSQIKQRQDSIAMFKKAHRQDLIGVEEAQMVVLQEFLPEQLSAEKILELVLKAIAETGASNPKDIGSVMKALQQLIRETGKDADSRSISELVRKELKC